MARVKIVYIDLTERPCAVVDQRLLDRLRDFQSQSSLTSSGGSL